MKIATNPNAVAVMKINNPRKPEKIIVIIVRKIKIIIEIAV